MIDLESKNIQRKEGCLVKLLHYSQTQGKLIENSEIIWYTGQFPKTGNIYILIHFEGFAEIAVGICVTLVLHFLSHSTNRVMICCFGSKFMRLAYLTPNELSYQMSCHISSRMVQLQNFISIRNLVFEISVLLCSDMKTPIISKLMIFW